MQGNDSDTDSDIDIAFAAMDFDGVDFDDGTGVAEITSDSHVQQDQPWSSVAQHVPQDCDAQKPMSDTNVQEKDASATSEAVTSKNSNNHPKTMERKAPPQLVFDDGSRIMAEVEPNQDTVETKVSPRGEVPIEEYYEISRLSKEALKIWMEREKAKAQQQNSTNDEEIQSLLFRVALQFPDELLGDSPDVCWGFEDEFNRLIQNMGAENNDVGHDVDDTNIQKPIPLVFVLGDTTFGPCCPDEVSAMHLEADILIHFGHACLSPAMSLPVLYGFGVTDMNVGHCADMVIEQTKEEGIKKLLLLYEVRYHHAMEELQTQLSERGDLLVLMGQIPEQNTSDLVESEATQKQSCCMGEDKPKDSGCCQANQDETACCETKTPVPAPEELPEQESSQNIFVVGGLEVPKDVDLSSYTLLFVGDTSQGSCSSRQYLNTLLRFVSCPSSSPSTFWTYSPANLTLETDVPPSVQRKLNRRFYLTQKARDASVFGILVGTLSQRHFRSVVSSLRSVIETSGRASYTFAVGKINGAKLANFGEIECFVLVACNENSLLDDERDLHVPVITPLELDMALGNVEWGSAAYSLDYNDFLSMQTSSSMSTNDDANKTLEDGEDAPYFSLVTGKYESKKKATGDVEDIDLKALPGKGQITQYESAAADYLKQREYKGLEANVGNDDIQAATVGQVGIASDYGQR